MVILMLLLTTMIMLMMMMMMLYNTNEEISCCPSRCVSVQLSTLAPHGSFKVAKVYFFKKQIMKPTFTPTKKPGLSVLHNFSYTNIYVTFCNSGAGVASALYFTILHLERKRLTEC